MTGKKIVVAGGTGELGRRICHYLLRNGADVHVLTRSGSDQKRSGLLKDVTVHEVSYDDHDSLTAICHGSQCIVSALSGLREVIIDTQSKLVEAGLRANVQRFIPSDFCIDYRPLAHGQNRNLDLRREFSTFVESTPIKATSILNGMFTDLLNGQAPVILIKQKRIFFWGNRDQKMDFTSIDNTAEFTAHAALDDTSPRWLSIAGQEASMRDLQTAATHVYKHAFKFLRPGGLRTFQMVINLTKTFAPSKDEIFPAWQGMQYLHDMLTGLPKHDRLDNNRYPAIKWQPIESVLTKSESKS
jgi:nucleoside-diphosphate-sugar epimerase